jgi:MscS family membrane protein
MQSGIPPLKQEQPPATPGKRVPAETAARSIEGAANELRAESRQLAPPELERSVLGLPLSDTLALLVLLGALLAFQLAARGLLRRYARPGEHGYLEPGRAALGRAIGQVVNLAVFLVALFLLLSFLPLGGAELRSVLWRIYLTLAIALGGLIAYRLIEIAIALLDRSGDSDSTLGQGIGPLLRNTAKIVLAVLILIGIVEAWGYSATGLVAGLGIGGLALAFAAQDTFSNVFGSFIIYGDRPYRIGDWVKVKEFEGIVEDIGMRSTRIRTFENTVLTVPNRDVTTNTVENFTTRDQRRVRFLLGVVYSTPPEKIERLRDDLTALLKSRADITERLLGVRFYEFGESSLNVLVSFCVAATDFATYHRVREEVLLWILRYCNERGIGIAFPTRSVWIEGLPPNFAASAASHSSAEGKE